MWRKAQSATIVKDCSRSLDYPKINTEDRAFWAATGKARNEILSTARIRGELGSAVAPNDIQGGYTGTGGFSDHVFAMCRPLGYRFVPRIRDLKEERRYLLPGMTVPPELGSGYQPNGKER